MSTINDPTEFRLTGISSRQKETLIYIRNHLISSKSFTMIAGPCAVESREQMFEIANAISEAGAQCIRGGAFKPRTSPYSFQGLGVDGLKYLKEAASRYNLLSISEVMSVEQADSMKDFVDILQIGSRNMQNFNLLKAVGKMSIPVLLKRGIVSTYREWLLAAEYILLGGNPNVILCERGIRNSACFPQPVFDVTAHHRLKKITHLPIFADPSHASTDREEVINIAKAALVSGFTGILVEIHPDPDKALSDAHHSLTIKQFRQLINELKTLIELSKMEWK